MTKFIATKAFLDHYNVPTKSLKVYHDSQSADTQVFTREQIYELIDIIFANKDNTQLAILELDAKLDEIFES